MFGSFANAGNELDINKC